MPDDLEFLFEDKRLKYSIIFNTADVAVLPNIDLASREPVASAP